MNTATTPLQQAPSNSSATQMSANDILFKELARPFDPNQIHWRLGATNAKNNGGKASKGIALAYINARDVMGRLDAVAGCFDWKTELTEVAGTAACTLYIRVDGEWVSRTDTSGQTAVDGEKGAASTALRRAAAQFGVGRYLYSLPNVWVNVGDYSKFDAPPLPKWALPENWDKAFKQIHGRYLR